MPSVVCPMMVPLRLLASLAVAMASRVVENLDLDVALATAQVQGFQANASSNPAVAEAVCYDIDPGWTDSDGRNCDVYASHQFCTYDGQIGDGWSRGWGDPKRWTGRGRSALEVCCACGGGTSLPPTFNAITHFTDQSTGLSCVHKPLCYGKDTGKTLLEFGVDAEGTNCFLKGQGSCNNCYAHAVSGMMSDRLCIAEAKLGTPVTPELLQQTLMSPQDLTSCGGGDGCEGLSTNSVQVGVMQMSSVGIVQYDCMPYWSWEGATGECPEFCRDGRPKTRYVANTWTNVGRKLRKDPDAIKKAIMEGGPVAAGFNLPSDFKPLMFEGSGQNGQGDVYIPAEGVSFGSGVSHAVKIIGWGWQMQLVRDKGAMMVPYWICQNSWGPDAAPTFKVLQEDEAKTLGVLDDWEGIGVEGSVYAVEGPYKAKESVGPSGSLGRNRPEADTIYERDGMPLDAGTLRNLAEAKCAYYGNLKFDGGCSDSLAKLTVKVIDQICAGYGVACRGRKAEKIAQLVASIGPAKPLQYNLGTR